MNFDTELPVVSIADPAVRRNGPLPSRQYAWPTGLTSSRISREELEAPNSKSKPCQTENGTALRRIEDRQFLSMQQAFAAHGGFIGGHEVARRMRHRSDQPISLLARGLVARTILSIEWHSQTLIPMFQFDASDMSRRCVVSQVICELASVFDDWELASWFAQPNVWLQDAAPVDVLERDGPAVQHAARADRYIACG